MAGRIRKETFSILLDASVLYRSHLFVPIRNQQTTKGFIMPIRILGKAIFPSLPAWQRERKIKHILVAIGVAFVFAAVVGGVMFASNARTH